MLHVCTCASHESYGSESSQKLLWVELLGSFQIKEHISLLDPFLHVVIMPKSSARFMWYCAFHDHPESRPLNFCNKGDAIMFMRKHNGCLRHPQDYGLCVTTMVTFAMRKTIKFKSNVGRGCGGGGICLSVS